MQGPFEHTVTHALPAELASAALRQGLSQDDLRSILSDFGPLALQVLQTILKHLSKRQEPPTAEPAKPAPEPPPLAEPKKR